MTGRKSVFDVFFFRRYASHFISGLGGKGRGGRPETGGNTAMSYEVETMMASCLLGLSKFVVFSLLP